MTTEEQERTVTPRPDPTSLTTAQLVREITALEKLMDARIAVLDTKFTARFEGVDRRFEGVDRRQAPPIPWVFLVTIFGIFGVASLSIAILLTK